MLSNGAVLHAAVNSGSLDMMAHVLELGAKVDERDSLTTMGFDRYGTPLLRAIANGKTDAVRFLLEKGASTTARGPTMRGHEGKTAMEMVREDWVVDEIRKMVEEVGERGSGETEKEKEGGEKEGKGTEKEREVEREGGGAEEREVEEREGRGMEKEREAKERDGGGTEKEREVEEVEERESGGMDFTTWPVPQGWRI